MTKTTPPDTTDTPTEPVDPAAAAPEPTAPVAVPIATADDVDRWFAQGLLNPDQVDAARKAAA